MEELIRKLLVEMGENPDREGLKKTPDRVAKSLSFLTKGYRENVDEIINGAVYKEKCNDMVIVKDIEFYSMCEHHILPFYGKCHIGYIPDGKVIGVSKLVRITEVYARRLQLQERLTRSIASLIKDKLNPKGVGIVMEAQHMCMTMRGVEKQHSKMVTSAMLGLFRRQETRLEFLDLIKR
ncbi:MAG: GTP cyclohydrolase I FolE [Victivallales bacterium]|nr:GTP cyclohydrolase I FolE [Victivallales bacterium]